MRILLTAALDAAPPKPPARPPGRPPKAKDEEDGAPRKKERMKDAPLLNLGNELHKEVRTARIALVKELLEDPRNPRAAQQAVAES